MQHCRRSSTRPTGTTRWASHNHAAGRALSAGDHAGVAEVDGFLFASRFTGDGCVAVFDRAFGKLTARGVDELIRHVELLDALDDYDIVLTEPPG